MGWPGLGLLLVLLGLICVVSVSKGVGSCGGGEVGYRDIRVLLLDLYC